MNIQLVYNGIFRMANELMKKRKNEFLLLKDLSLTRD